jgi:CBS domain-containing protein
MKVKDILEKKGSHVWTVGENATIHDALGLLLDHRIGALVVLDEKNQIAGIISERDIIRECFKHSRQTETTHVSEVMTRKLIVGTLEDPMDYIMGIMTNNRIRHIPIIQEGKLQGMISIGDVVKAQLQDTEYENRYLKDYMFGTGPGGR